MTDLVQVKSGVLGDRTEMPNLVENELGYRKDEKALYIGTSSGNVRLCGADDIGGGGGAEELNAIGDAIRDITGGTEFIPVADMPAKVYEVYEQGQAEGVETGKQEMFDAWWDTISRSGTKKAWTRGFSEWRFPSIDLFRPPYTIVIEGACDSMFYNASATDGGTIDLVALEEELGYPIFDTSGMTRSSYMFQNCYLFSHVGTLDLSKCTASQCNWYMFFQPSYVAKLKSIKKLIVSKDTDYTGMFTQGTSIEHCVFEGVIAKSGLNMSACTKLDKESHISIVNCLSADTSGLSVTVSKTAVNKAFETSNGANNGSTSAEWTALKGTKPNWTINEA